MCVYSKTAISLLGALELDQLAIDAMCASDNNFKFLNIVTDGSAVNKLAAKIMTILRDSSILATIF